MKLLVLGIGNILMNDDAAGALAAQRLAERYEETDELRIVEGGTLGLDLLPMVEWADKLILIDAVDVDHPCGTVVRIEGEDVEPVFETKLSPHQMGMKDLLLTAELAGYRPEEVTLFGIQSGNVNMDMTLSPEVEANMDKLVNLVGREIELFLEER
ncbi:HyaD/HybD family hydrogenase maturation endopeptidase [Limisalsivibrio acetivorans]|uniref:HyaD/HybD family hydrogenase maturation endopeptidase n=1 Tax=Limisalsivibrio acetivorans TaxID=1304888 RepID=UPI0003B795C6|nr:HyaD/HybD family hydrogenase maturation endopeptidase [Limisalsivibrio acetivorans]